jgi:hypothetical protein
MENFDITCSNLTEIKFGAVNVLATLTGNLRPAFGLRYANHLALCVNGTTR